MRRDQTLATAAVLTAALAWVGGFWVASADGSPGPTATDQACTPLAGRTLGDSVRYVIGVRRYDTGTVHVDCPRGTTETVGFAPGLAFNEFDAGVKQVVENTFRTRQVSLWTQRLEID